MLEALRSGDRKKIELYGDIAPISIENFYSAYLARLPRQEAAEIPIKRGETSLSEQAVLKLLELDVEPVTAKRLVGKAVASHMELRKVGDIVKIAYQAYLSSETQDALRNEEDGDLRNTNDYDAMKSIGLIKNAEW